MIRKEITIFLIVGFLSVLFDYSSYRILVGMGIVSVDFGKAVGFVFGTIFAYFSNRMLTFGHVPHSTRSIWRFMMLYISTLGVNVLVNAIALNFISNKDMNVRFAFFIATGFSAFLNFIGLKFFVFRSNSDMGSQ